MYLEDKAKCNQLLDFWSKKHDNNMLSVHYEVKTNILENNYCHFSNDFITIMWQEFHKRFN